MDIRRTILFAALALVSLSLWNAWQAEHPPVALSASSPTSSSKEPIVPQMESVNTAAPVNMENPEASIAPSSSSLVEVKTDVLNVQIDLLQGEVVLSQLLQYQLSVEDKNKPFSLLKNSGNERYVANSNLLVSSAQGTRPLPLKFSSSQSNYVLQPDQKQLVVRLTAQEGNLDVVKEFIFTKGSYLVEVHYNITNQGTEAWKGYLNTQLLRTPPQDEKSSIFQVGSSYTGASYSEPGKHRYQKVSFSDMGKNNLDVDTKGGWIAMQQHYFLTAWVPPATADNKFYTRTSNGEYLIGAVSQPVTINPQDKASMGSRLYMGPEITSDLQKIAPSLDLTVDYGILWFVSSLLFSLMKAIYNVVGNWGWSIVLVTVLIKLAFYRLSATSYKSMAGMRKLQPKLQALRERYGDDKAKISQATMELYRQEKVNPLGGCLPILIQIPVFIALYWVLLESVELRQAPFILWINDLAAADPYHVLPLIMGATMLIQQKLNPAPPDPMQAKVMMFLPVLFTGLFWNFPAGLVLYWIVNNTLSILQQWYITNKYSEDKPAKKLAVSTK